MENVTHNQVDSNQAAHATVPNGEDTNNGVDHCAGENDLPVVEDSEIPTAPASWEVARPNRIESVDQLTGEQRDRMYSAWHMAFTGFGILELEAGGKIPYGYGTGDYGWKSNLLHRREEIEARFLQEPDMNYGVCPYDGKHVIIDLDNKVDKDGSFIDGVANWEQWVADQGESMPETMVVESRNGGRHIFLKVQSPVGNSASGLPEGVDVRGQGGLSVIKINGRVEVFS